MWSGETIPRKLTKKRSIGHNPLTILVGMSYSYSAQNVPSFCEITSGYNVFRKPGNMPELKVEL